MQRILVLGGGGMLGHKLCQLLPEAGFEVTATFRGRPDVRLAYPGVYQRVQAVENVDVLDFPRLTAVLNEVRPHAVVNAIGIIKQLAESHNRYLSVGINSWLPHWLARWCADAGSRLIHISTDCVFTGKQGNYVETDPSDAQDLYGQTKHLGETDEHEPAAVTLRTSIIGRELQDPGHGLVEWFLSQQGLRIRGYERAIFTGLTTHELAGVIARVIRQHPELTGTWHVSAPVISKYDLLRLVREIYQVDITIDSDTTFHCDRSLNSTRFQQATGYRCPDWPTLIQQMHADPIPYDDCKRHYRELTAKWKEHAFRSC